MLAFNSGGLVVFSRAISEGQLMFSPIKFIVAPLPFGILFSASAYAFLQEVKKNKKVGIQLNYFNGGYGDSLFSLHFMYNLDGINRCAEIDIK